MRLFKSALANQRWDLAAHVIVLASARVLSRRRLIARTMARTAMLVIRPKG